MKDEKDRLLREVLATQDKDAAKRLYYLAGREEDWLTANLACRVLLGDPRTSPWETLCDMGYNGVRNNMCLGKAYVGETSGHQTWEIMISITDSNRGWGLGEDVQFSSGFKLIVDDFVHKEIEIPSPMTASFPEPSVPTSSDTLVLRTPVMVPAHTWAVLRLDNPQQKWGCDPHLHFRARLYLE